MADSGVPKTPNGAGRRRLAVAVAVVLSILAAIVTMTVVMRTPPVPLPIHHHVRPIVRPKPKPKPQPVQKPKPKPKPKPEPQPVQKPKPQPVQKPKPKMKPKPKPIRLHLRVDPASLKAGATTELTVSTDLAAGSLVRLTAAGGPQPTQPTVRVRAGGIATEPYADPQAGTVRFAVTPVDGGPTAVAEATWAALPKPKPKPVAVTATRSRTEIATVAATCAKPGSVVATVFNATRRGERVGTHTAWGAWGPWVKLESTAKTVPALSCPTVSLHLAQMPNGVAPLNVSVSDPGPWDVGPHGLPAQVGEITATVGGAHTGTMIVDLGGLTPLDVAQQQSVLGQYLNLPVTPTGYAIPLADTQTPLPLLFYARLGGTYTVRARIDGASAQLRVTVPPPSCAPGQPMLARASGGYTLGAWQTGGGFADWPAPQSPITLPAGQPEVVAVQVPCTLVPSGATATVQVGPGLVSTGARVQSTYPVAPLADVFSPNPTATQPGQVAVAILGTAPGASWLRVRVGGHTVRVAVTVLPPIAASGTPVAGDIQPYLLDICDAPGTGLPHSGVCLAAFPAAMIGGAPGQPIRWLGLRMPGPTGPGDGLYVGGQPVTGVRLVHAPTVVPRDGMVWVVIRVTGSPPAAAGLMVRIGASHYGMWQW